jgi:hypothetical protein
VDGVTRPPQPFADNALCPDRRLDGACDALEGLHDEQLQAVIDEAEDRLERRSQAGMKAAIGDEDKDDDIEERADVGFGIAVTKDDGLAIRLRRFFAKSTQG